MRRSAEPAVYVAVARRLIRGKRPWSAKLILQTALTIDGGTKFVVNCFIESTNWMQPVRKLCSEPRPTIFYGTLTQRNPHSGWRKFRKRNSTRKSR